MQAHINFFVVAQLIAPRLQTYEKIDAHPEMQASLTMKKGMGYTFDQ